MTERELKVFAINFINKKEKENENCVRYSYYELKVKYNLTEQEIGEVLKISKNYFENKSYRVYFVGDEYEYNNARMKVESNEYMVAIRKEGL